jgi:hypothetical protein
MKTSLLPLKTPQIRTGDPEPVTIIGTVTDSSGRPACSGWVDFILQPESQALDYSVLPDIVVATPTRARIVAGGQLVADCSRNDPFVVWPNDLILPANSLYQVVIAPGGRVTRVLNGVLISQSVNPQSLASLTFVSPQNQVVGPIVNANPLVTMSVVPGITGVWTIGTSTQRYANGYFDELTVGTLNVSNIVGWTPPPATAAAIEIPFSNMFGQPQPGQICLLYTAVVPLTFPANFAGSYGSVGVNPTATCIYTVWLNGASVGTITVSPAGAFTFSTSGFTMNPGGRLTATAPDPMDATMSDVAVTLVGNS